MATLEQSRARFALERVEAIKGKGPDKKAKYKTQLLKLPARLHANGLGQTVAFYLAAGEKSPEAEICGWLESWFHKRKLYADKPLIDGVVGKDMTEAAAEVSYRRASAEARALAVWLKRFAEAFIEGERE